MPVSGSTYSYAYTTLGEFVAMGVAACLLLEYGVSTAAVAVGWSRYLNKLLENIFGFRLPQAISAAPWDADPGIVNLPAVVLVVMCALLLIRGASESAKVNTVMVVIKLGVLVHVHRHRVHRVQDRPLRRLRADGRRRHRPRRQARSSSRTSASTRCRPPVTRSRTRRRPCRAPSSRALLIVTSVYVLVAFAGLGAQPLATEFEGQARPGWPSILDNIPGHHLGSTVSLPER